MAIVGRYFEEYLGDAASTYRLLQGLGSSLCSYLTPLFISADANACTPAQLVVEMVVASGMSVVAYGLLLVFLKSYKKDGEMSITPREDE